MSNFNAFNINLSGGSSGGYNGDGDGGDQGQQSGSLGDQRLSGSSFELSEEELEKLKEEKRDLQEHVLMQAFFPEGTTRGQDIDEDAIESLELPQLKKGVKIWKGVPIQY